MPVLTIDREKIKQKCSITGTDYDDAIDDLIDEWQPVLEYIIVTDALASEDAGLAATLTLGVAELIAGEFLAQIRRTPTAPEPPPCSECRCINPADPSGLKKQGVARLKPYLRVLTPAEVGVAGGK